MTPFWPKPAENWQNTQFCSFRPLFVKKHLSPNVLMRVLPWWPKKYSLGSENKCVPLFWISRYYPAILLAACISFYLRPAPPPAQTRMARPGRSAPWAPPVERQPGRCGGCRRCLVSVNRAASVQFVQELSERCRKLRFQRLMVLEEGRMPWFDMKKKPPSEWIESGREVEWCDLKWEARVRCGWKRGALGRSYIFERVKRSRLPLSWGVMVSGCGARMKLRSQLTPVVVLMMLVHRAHLSTGELRYCSSGAREIRIFTSNAFAIYQKPYIPFLNEILYMTA